MDRFYEIIMSIMMVRTWKPKILPGNLSKSDREKEKEKKTQYKQIKIDPSRTRIYKKKKKQIAKKYEINKHYQ